VKKGIWLVTFKKASGMPHLAYNDAVEEGLCFGWVDSKPGKVDELRSKLWFAPRKPGTGWSKPNKERIARLVATGLMQAAGLSEVEAAKRMARGPSWMRWKPSKCRRTLKPPSKLIQGRLRISLSFRAPQSVAF